MEKKLTEAKERQCRCRRRHLPSDPMPSRLFSLPILDWDLHLGAYPCSNLWISAFPTFVTLPLALALALASLDPSHTYFTMTTTTPATTEKKQDGPRLACAREREDLVQCLLRSDW